MAVGKTATLNCTVANGRHYKVRVPIMLTNNSDSDNGFTDTSDTDTDADDTYTGGLRPK